MTIEPKHDGTTTDKVDSARNTGIPPSSKATIDEALATLSACKDEWITLEIEMRINILDEILHDLQAVASRWIAAGIAAQDLADNRYGSGEKYVTFSIVYRQVRLLRQSLQDIQQTGRPRIPGAIRTRPNGQMAVPVFPQGWYDRLSLPGVTAEIWLQPDAPQENGKPAQAAFYRGDAVESGVALVLGVGNVAALNVADFMHKLFVEARVVMLKPSPVNAYVGPLIEEGFRALIERGYLRVVYGGAEEGSYLVQHPLLDEIHMTGSEKTFDAILFGPGQEGARRKAERRPRLTKPVTAELGNLSPVIVVPGPWDKSDIEAQAGKLGTWLSINAGYTCLAPRMIVNWHQWPQRDALNEAIADFLARIPTRKPYYPGTVDIYHRFVEAHPEALELGEPRKGDLPWALIPGLDPQQTDDICFTQEAFCGLFGETSLEAESVEGFLEKAVDFVNETLWGTLVATILVHPQSLKDPAVAAAVERAVERLRYGTVVINLSGVIAYFLATTSWGGYPGQDISDVQSGIGTVNNVLMLDHPQKSVVRAPFKQKPDPFLATSRNVVSFGKSMVAHQFSPSPRTLFRLMWEALRS